MAKLMQASLCSFGLNAAFRFLVPSYIIHLTSLGCFLAKRGFSSGWVEISKEIDGVAEVFLLVGLKSRKRLMVWLGAFI